MLTEGMGTNMKKGLIAVLCLIMIMTLGACGSGTGSMSYEDYNLDEYIEVGQYKGLEVNPYVVSVSQDEVDAEIEKTLESSTKEKKLSEGKVLKKGDTANIDYVGRIDGKKFDGGSAQGTDLELGSGTFIDGFEDGLIGKKVGETVDLNLTFPEDYGTKEYAGKDAVFTVTVNSATRQVAMTEEEYVKSKGDYDSVADYRKAVKRKLINEKEETAMEDQKKSLWSDAIDNTKVIKYPEREVTAYEEFNSAQIYTAAANYGVSREELLSQYGFKGEDDFASVNEDSSKLRVKQEMMAVYIANKEGITYSDKEAETMLQNLKDSGFDEESIKEQTGRTVEDYIHVELLYEKVLDFLLDNAKIKGTAKSY